MFALILNILIVVNIVDTGDLKCPVYKDDCPQMCVDIKESCSITQTSNGYDKICYKEDNTCEGVISDNVGCLLSNGQVIGGKTIWITYCDKPGPVPDNKGGLPIGTVISIIFNVLFVVIIMTTLIFKMYRRYRRNVNYGRMDNGIFNETVENLEDNED